MNDAATLSTLRDALNLVGARLKTVAPYTFAGKANGRRAVVTLQNFWEHSTRDEAIALVVVAETLTGLGFDAARHGREVIVTRRAAAEVAAAA